MTYQFWQRYLSIFDHVSVVARVRQVDQAPPSYTRVDGQGVSVQGMPEYVGPWEYLRVRRAFQQASAAATSPEDAVLLRAGCSPLAAAIETTLARRHQPFGVEVITDPYRVFAPGAIRHPLRPVFRRMFTHQLQRQCVRSAAATYVTQSALQERYPAGPTTFSTSYSDVDLPPEAFVRHHRSGALVGDVPTIISIGSMAQPYKGFDVLIDAIAHCAQRSLAINLILVGDGKHRQKLEQRVCRLGLQRRVTFTGQLAGGPSVREQLDQSDLFVMASRTEGLPRAMIEAQARGLPCIGTRVGGIPELLDGPDLVPVDDFESLAMSIMQMLCDSGRRARASADNLALARTYGEAELTERRTTFLRELRHRTVAAAPHTLSGDAERSRAPMLPLSPPDRANRHGRTRR